VSDRGTVDHVAETIATYDRIAPSYVVTATPEMRAWEERSMRTLHSFLPGRRVLVPGCGDGRDSRFLSSLGLDIVSFDLSHRMLEIARDADPTGAYVLLDIRQMSALVGSFDGVYASGCLYHLNKAEFARCIRECHRLLSPGGILYLNMKEGQGERFESRPLPGSPGGDLASKLLVGNRFYAYYSRSELLSHLERFDIVKEDRIVVARGGFEFWLRRRS
jgi:SAM-dependent methyltransferase